MLYNRYIPQPDGSHRRNTIVDKDRHTENFQAVQAEPAPSTGRAQNKPEGIMGFLKQLLPKNLDTTDLLVVLLILLMAGEDEENRNNALLTLALYFFM